MSENQHAKIDSAIEKAMKELESKPFQVDESKGAKQAIEDSNSNSREFTKELLSKTLHNMFG